MIGLDTNVIVRCLGHDDPVQSAAASTAIEALTENALGFVSLVTTVELYWVLRRAYKISTARCAQLVEGLLDARELRVDQESVVRAALIASSGGLDFAVPSSPISVEPSAVITPSPSVSEGRVR